MSRSAGVLAAAVLALAAGRAEALPLGFACVSGGSTSCTIGAAQLQAELGAGPGAGQARFDFTNTGSASASLTDVYFDAPDWLSFASLIDGAGVDFEPGGRPRTLPGGSAVEPAFETSFGADSEAPTLRNGVNPGETLAIVFDLGAGHSLADVAAALADGSLRVGLHVQGFAHGGSASFVNVAPTGLPPGVPEPRAALLLGAGLLGAWLGRRRSAGRPR